MEQVYPMYLVPQQAILLALCFYNIIQYILSILVKSLAKPTCLQMGLFLKAYHLSNFMACCNQELT